MRTPRVALAVTLALAMLTACVSRVGPSVARLTEHSRVAGECGAADVRVHGGLDEEPSITLPRGCAPPTTLVARDVVVGDGEQAKVGADLMVNYVLFSWADGTEVDSSWAGRDELAFEVTDLGRGKIIAEWNRVLPGIREGGRRLLVVPASKSADGPGAPALVYIVDAVRITG